MSGVNIDRINIYIHDSTNHAYARFSELQLPASNVTGVCAIHDQLRQLTYIPIMTHDDHDLS